MGAARLRSLAPSTLYQYANEMAWREDNRRVSNGINFKFVTAAALRHPKSAVWAGYWQRAAA
jgi:hypothetical protein